MKYIVHENGYHNLEPKDLKDLNDEQQGTDI